MAKPGQTKQTILKALQQGPQTSYALGVATNQPQPSVRRVIGTLRKDGYEIATEGTGMNALYSLATTVVAHPSPRAVSQADGFADAYDTDIDAGDTNDFFSKDDGDRDLGDW